MVKTAKKANVYKVKNVTKKFGRIRPDRPRGADR
jgi:hypothetical protein